MKTKYPLSKNHQGGLSSSVVGQSLSLRRDFNGYGEISSESFSINNLRSSIWNLSRNDNGQIITKQMTVNGTTSNFAYTYDPMGRLLTVTKDGTLVEEYRYGANGARSYEMNLLRGIPGRDYTYSSEDQVLTTGDFSYRYDVDGFLAIKNTSGTTTTYEYATRGELMKVVLPSGDVIEYVNDPLGRRIAKKVNGTITEKYLWQGLTRLLAIYDDSDNLLERFIYADSRLPVAMQSGGNTYYLAYDQVGSLISVADSSGNVIKSVTYDSFGNVIQDSAPTVWIPIGFAGGMIDADTGLVRFGFREYSPEIGRWTAKDPILFLGGMDLYEYCLNDPINKIDLTGLFTWYYGGSATGYLGDLGAGLPAGSATAGVGSIGYSNETGWFNGNYATYGAQADRSGKWDTLGAGIGIGPVIGFFTGSICGFSGPTDNYTGDLGFFALTFSRNSSGWGFSGSWGGKGVGLGYYFNTTTTVLWPCECK